MTLHAKTQPPSQAPREGYAGQHRDRTTLLVHLMFVPLFMLASASMLVFLLSGNWVLALLAAVACTVSLLVQGAVHRRTVRLLPKADSRIAALGQLLREQWIEFPRFVLSGGWLRAYRAAGQA